MFILELISLGIARLFTNDTKKAVLLEPIISLSLLFMFLGFIYIMVKAGIFVEIKP